MRHISKHQIARADKVFCGRLGATPILKHPAFKYSFKICGYENHTYGAVTGPVVAISNLFHEVAHSIEFVINGDSVFDRGQHGRFDFHINQVYQFGDLYLNTSSIACSPSSSSLDRYRLVVLISVCPITFITTVKGAFFINLEANV